MKDTITITLIGNASSGKSNLASRYAINEYRENSQASSTSDIYKCDFDFSGNKITILLWDTPGHERYRNKSEICIKRGDIIILVYCVDDRRSFEDIKEYWLPTVKEECKNDANGK